MGKPPGVIYSIGHSTRSLEELIRLLREAAVRLLADVRTVPRSRRNPQFNTDALARSLPAAGIDYLHMPGLGGLRGRSRDAPPSVNSAWEESAFRNYADYALTPAFEAALAELLAAAAEHTVAYMCAEALWWQCHRRIITDHLLARGVVVRHILGEGRVEEAKLAPFARVRGDGKVIYPGLVPG